MTQIELFTIHQAGNVTMIEPVGKPKLIYRDPPLPDMRGQPPAVAVATSVAAADAIKPCAETLRRKVFEFIRLNGKHGATDQECQDALGMAGSTQRPRRIELFQQGKICMAPMMRKTRSNRDANVWVVTA